MLVLLFFVCGAVGYFVGGVLSSDEPEVATVTVQKEEIVEVSRVPEVAEVPEVKISTKPVITNTPAPIKNSDNKTYRLIVEATVESGDKLSYSITTSNNDIVAPEREDGIFEKLPHSSNGEYLVWVKNIVTGENVCRTVTGFNKVEAPKPSIVALTVSELNQSLNNTDGMVPVNISSRFSSKQKVVNAANGSIVSSNFNTLWTDMFMGVAKYKVTKVVVDQSTNMLVEIHVNVL